MQPNYDKNLFNSNILYVLYLVNDSVCVKELDNGCIDDLLKYDFGEGKNLINSFESFDIKWIL